MPEIEKLEQHVEAVKVGSSTKPKLDTIFPILVTFFVTAIGILTGSIAIWNFISSKMEERLKLEMRVQAIEMNTKELKDNAWTLRGDVQKHIDEEHAKREILIERIMKLELSKNQ